MLLVVRDLRDLSDAGRSAIGQLKPFLLRENNEWSWPGTVLHSRRPATVFRYSLTPEAVRVAATFTERLFEWQRGLPEDLCMFTEQSRPWLVTIAHEHDGYFDLTQDEHRALVEAVPSLKLRDDASVPLGTATK